MDYESSPPSRWQQLYPSSHHDAENSDDFQSYELDVDFDDYDNEASVTQWLQNMESKEPEMSLQYNTYKNELLDSIEENEADKIMNDLDHILRTHEQQHEQDDELMMEHILDSKRHQEGILQYRTKKKIQSLLCQWRAYTKSQLSNRKVMSDALNNKRCYNLKSMTFKSWTEVWFKKRSIVEEFLSDRRKKLLRHCLCAWTENVSNEFKSIKVRDLK
jgi:hypothetical protein